MLQKIYMVQSYTWANSSNNPLVLVDIHSILTIHEIDQHPFDEDLLVLLLENRITIQWVDR